MSRINLDYRYLDECEGIERYKVLSPDFNERSQLDEIGILSINKKLKNYEFFPTNIWQGVEVMPPEVYELPEYERILLVNSKYLYAKYGAWTGRIGRYARKLLKE